MNDLANAVRSDPRLAARMEWVYNTEWQSALVYAYRHLLTEGLDNEASNLFFDLSREDAENAHTLGRLIRALGGDPGMNLRLRMPRIDLSADAVCRALPLVRRMVRQALASEAATVTELESIAAATQDEAVGAILRGVILTTRAQYERLSALAQKL